MVSVAPTFFSKKVLPIFHLLLLFYPLLYFMQQNVVEFSLNTYLNTFMYVVVYEVVLLILYILSQILCKKWLHGIYVTLLALGVCAVLSVTLCSNIPITGVFCTLTLLSVSYILYYKNFIKPVAVLLSLMCVFSFIRYTIAVSSVHEEDVLSEYPQMKTKPNIYFLILESYHGSQALEQLYGFDNSGFLNDLVQNNFTVYENIYATRPVTRLSLLSIFTLSNTTELYDREYLLDGCLSGKAHCKVLDILKANGYEIKNKFANNYLVHDYFDIPNKNKFLCNTLFSKQYPQYFSKCFYKDYQYKTVDDYNADLIKTLNNLDDKSAPYMFITKIGGITEDFKTYSGGVAHIPNHLRHTDKVELIQNFKAAYVEELKKENVALMQIISAITTKDPNAMIIMFGDHGAGYLDILKEKSDEIPSETYLLDFFDVMAAVRFPKSTFITEKWQYLPQMFNVIFDALGVSMEKAEISPTFYDYKNNLLFEEENK